MWSDIALLSVNTNGIKRNGRKLIDRVISQYHIVGIQETKFRNSFHLSKFQFHLSTTSNHIIFVSDKNSTSPVQIGPRSGGVATLIHPELPGADSAEVVASATVPGRYLLIRLTVESTTIYIHNVYAPVRSAERRQFFEELPTNFDSSSRHIVLGDLNVAIDPILDSRGVSSVSDSSRGALLAWISSLGVTDPWRLRFPSRRLFSSPLPRLNRLDYVLYSDSWIDASFDHISYFQAPHSGDHLAVRVVFGRPHRRPQPGYWRLRSTTLDDQLLREYLSREIRELAGSIAQAPNPGSVWEGWKRRIRSRLKFEQARLKSQQDDLLRATRRELAVATAHHQIAGSRESSERVNQATAALESTLIDRQRRTADEGFDFHAHKMETSSTYFFRPPAPTLRSTAVPSVLLPSGSESSDPIDVSATFRQHWGKVFGDCRLDDVADLDDSASETLLDSISRNLSPAQSSWLDEPITAEELAATIRHLRPQSAPGLDGLGAALYQIDPDAFGEVLRVVFNSQLSHGTLSCTQRRACVTLLYKKGDRRDPGNYRPISLMQVDVKILSKTLAYRLHRFLHLLIHPDQKGFVKGRSLHHHIRFLHDLQSLLLERGEQGFALFLDFAKAYDRVNWTYLFKVLQRVGCGPGFCSWVRLLYRDSQAVLSLNGTLLEPLFPTRGVKQGDPLSSLLFVLSIEPLGNLIRRSRMLGIPVTSSFMATGLYFADDSTLLSSSLSGLERQIDLVRTYCAGSGAILNLNKSQLLVLGRGSVESTDSSLNLSSSPSVVYLGVPVGHTNEVDRVLGALETRFYSRLAQWRNRGRTFRGRLLILQAMLLSILWHVTPHFELPEAMIRRLQSTAEQFLLTRRGVPGRRFVKLAKPFICYVPFDRGGLQIPNISTIIQRQRIKLLQQLSLLPFSEPWYAVTVALMDNKLPGSSPSYPFDILSIPFSRRSRILHLEQLTSWWQHTVNTKCLY